MANFSETIHLGERSKTNRLDFFADFAVMDIDSLDLGDLIRLDISINAIAAGGIGVGWYHAAIADPEGEAEKRKKAALKAFQSDFKDRFDDVMQRILNTGDAEQREWTENESFFKGFFEADITSSPPPFPGLRVDLVDQPVHTESDALSYVEIPGEYDGNRARWAYNWQKKGRIRTQAKVLGSLQDTFFSRFLEALDGVKWSSCLRCPECGRFFFNLTKRKKEFCTPSCSSRFGVRRGRALKKITDPAGYEKELAENRNRARKSYVRKVKAKNPKAKVKRRPLKKN